MSHALARDDELAPLSGRLLAAGYKGGGQADPAVAECRGRDGGPPAGGKALPTTQGSLVPDGGGVSNKGCRHPSESALDGQDTGWASLTAAILISVLAELAGSEAKQLRCVCWHWRNCVDHNLESLAPRAILSRQLVARFRNLHVLRLDGCQHLRNRDLMVLTGGAPGLHTLALGDAPWVTNTGLAHIARLPGLTSLSVAGCAGVTNTGVAALGSGLPCLASLSLRGCRKLTGAGLGPLGRASALTRLDLGGCSRLGDSGMLALRDLQLESLHLGGTKVGDEGLAHLAVITTLQELYFDMERLTDAGVLLLTSLTRLESLALRSSEKVSGASISVLAPALPSLASLDLHKSITMDDSQLSHCLESLGSLTYLDLRGTPITEDGLRQLTRLSLLQKLCLAPTKEGRWSEYLSILGSLTQLTSLAISNCSLGQLGQLEALQWLQRLHELDLSHNCEEQERQSCQLDPAVVHAVAAITSLTFIDLSGWPLREEHLRMLAERLPRLSTLVMIGCPVLPSEAQSVQRSFPRLTLHCSRQSLGASGNSCVCSSVSSSVSCGHVSR